MTSAEARYRHHLAALARQIQEALAALADVDRPHESAGADLRHLAVAVEGAIREADRAIDAAALNRAA